MIPVNMILITTHFVSTQPSALRARARKRVVDVERASTSTLNDVWPRAK